MTNSSGASDWSTSAQMVSVEFSSGRSMSEEFVGNTNSTTDNFDGDIAEILIFNGTLTTTEHTKIKTYLNGKYSVY